MDTHSFNIDIAKDLGIGAAFIHNIAHWVLRNAANNENYYEGFFWTYNSAQAFLEIFTYLTKEQLRTVIKNAIEKGYLKKGNFNKNPHDRTLWYTLTEKSIEFYPKLKELLNNKKLEIKDISNDLKPNDDASQLHLLNFTNGKIENPKCLKETDINPNINVLKIKNKKEKFDEEKNNKQEYVSLKNKTTAYRDLTTEPEPHPHDTAEIREKHFKKHGIVTNFHDIKTKKLSPIAKLISNIPKNIVKNERKQGVNQFLQ